MDTSQTLVKDALEDFYKSHDFGDEALTQTWVDVKMGPLKFPFPNPKQRRDVIYLHDLTHLMTGYDTTWTGEGEIAAWELASGFPAKYWIGWIYPPMTFAIGMLIAPRKVLKAFAAGWRKPNLYKLDIPRDKVERMTLRELKARLSMILFAGLVFSSLACRANMPVENIEIQKADDVAIVKVLDSQIISVTESISKCTKTNKSNPQCICENKIAIERLNSVLRQTLEKRPIWRTKTLNMKSTNGKTIILDMPGLILQAQHTPCT